ncbi:unnamed protein product, partial [Symbiodinium pilosum]
MIFTATSAIWQWHRWAVAGCRITTSSPRTSRPMWAYQTSAISPSSSSMCPLSCPGQRKHGRR